MGYPRTPGPRAHPVAEEVAVRDAGGYARARRCPVSGSNYRGVPLAAPDEAALRRLLAEVDPGGTTSRLIERGREVGAALQQTLGGLYRAGMREGVDRALALGAPAAAPRGADIAPEPTPRPVRSPIQAVVARYRNAELRLPPLPEVGAELNRLLADPDFDLDAVVGLVRRDATLTAKVMALAASPIFAGGSLPPRTLQAAILRIGTRELAKCLMTFTNRRLFTFQSARSEAALRDLWHHSLMTAILAERLAGEVQGVSPGAAFLHGLLHDMGRAILLQIFDELADEGFGEEEVRRTIDGLHGQFGAALLKKWHFADTFSEVAMFHHQPQKAFGQVRLVALVSLADFCACRAGVGYEWETFAGAPIDHPATAILNLTGEALSRADAQGQANFQLMSQLT